MLVIAGSIVIDPTKREAAIVAAKEMMAATRREPGCRGYTFSLDLEDPGRVHLFEHWDSQSALDSHFQTAHMTRFNAAVAGLGVREAVIQKFEVSTVGPLR
ncbi:MAG TPA: putative quinol monooxygenase [Myxococcota bacterium]|nr:putative quinol monooxygenase [Myxococcota bacterium]